MSKAVLQVVGNNGPYHSRPNGSTSEIRSSCASIAAGFPRHINQRNDDGNCADDLADCTNRFPIHGMIHVIASDIQSQRAGILEGQSSARWQEDAASWQVRSSGSGSWIYLTG